VVERQKKWGTPLSELNVSSLSFLIHVVECEYENVQKRVLVLALVVIEIKEYSL